MRELIPFGWLVLYLLGSTAVAAGPEYDLVQPIESRSRLVLQSARGRARVERTGSASQTLRLRSDEVLTTLAETHGGWTAAGIREEESTTSLIIITRSSQGTQRLTPPASRRHPLRLRPILAVEGERLDGMAWLEGTDFASLSVRAASRAQDGWSDVSVIAPPARGSQTGLVAVVLSDGSWLLVWSAFDGQDDEILWSMGQQDNWSRPTGVHKNNTAPDIMPALVATTNGALLTWSRLIDGEYQLVLSRLKRSGGWSRPQVIGPPGSLEPAFVIQDDQLLLVYRHAWPRAWAVTEVSLDGSGRRLAVFSEDVPSRPVVLRSSGENVEIRWPGNRKQVEGWEALP